MIIRRMKFSKEADAREAMRLAGVDPRGVEIMAPKMLHSSWIAGDLHAGACNIIKQEMLSLGGEAAVARGTVNMAVERSDVIISGTRRQLSKLVVKLKNQPFGLAELAIALEEALAGICPAAILQNRQSVIVPSRKSNKR